MDRIKCSTCGVESFHDSSTVLHCNACFKHRNAAMATLQADLEETTLRRSETVAMCEQLWVELERVRDEKQRIWNKLDAAKHAGALVQDLLDASRQQLAAREGQLETVTKERDSFKAVLEGAEYQHLDVMAKNTIEQSMLLGKEAARRVRQIVIERDFLKDVAGATREHQRKEIEELKWSEDESLPPL